MFDRLIHRIKSVYRRFENPLLMKELRQAMRSRIYVYVFMSILFVSLFLMALFLLTHRGRVELTRGVGRTAFGLLYVSFVSVALLMIPMTAFLSQREEVEKDRLDLIRITNLTPSQIVRGKIVAAVVNLLLFLTALVPFYAFTYLLGGISFFSIIFTLYLTVLGAILLITLSVFFAMLVTGGFTKVLNMLLVIALATGGGFILYAGLWRWLLSGGSSPFGITEASFGQRIGVLALLACFGVSSVYLFYQCSRSLILPKTRNRTRPVRLAFLILAALGLVTPFLLGYVKNIMMSGPFGGVSLFLWPLLMLFGLVWSTEEERPKNGVHSERTERASSYVSRLFLPGGTWGYHFTFVCCLLFIGGALLAGQLDRSRGVISSFQRDTPREVLVFQCAASAYLITCAGLARHLGHRIRSTWNGVRLRTVRAVVIGGFVTILIGSGIVRAVLESMGSSMSNGWLALLNPLLILMNIVEDGTWFPPLLILCALGLTLWLQTVVTSIRSMRERSSAEDPR